MAKVANGDEKEVVLGDASVTRDDCAENGDKGKDKEHVADAVRENQGAGMDREEGWGRGCLAGYEVARGSVGGVEADYAGVRVLVGLVSAVYTL
jgi:hypothetical protein